MNDWETQLLNTIHDKLLQEWRNGARVNPLFFYALNPDYLSDKAYEIIENHVQEIAQWNNHPGLLKPKALTLILYHIRKFFEKGDGRDIWNCLNIQGARQTSFGLLLGMGNSKDIINAYSDYLFPDELLIQLGSHDIQAGYEAYNYGTWFRYNCPFIAAKEGGQTSEHLRNNKELIFSDTLTTFFAQPWEYLQAENDSHTTICCRAAEEYIQANQDIECKEDGRLNALGFNSPYIHALLLRAPEEFLIGLKGLITDKKAPARDEAIKRWPWMKHIWGEGEREYAYWSLRESPVEACCYLSLRKVKVGAGHQQIGLYQIEENSIWGRPAPGMTERNTLRHEGTVFCRIRRRDCRILSNDETQPLPHALFILTRKDTVVSLRYADGEDVPYHRQNLSLFRAQGDEKKLEGYGIIKIDLMPLRHEVDGAREFRLKLQIGAKEHRYTFRRSATLQMDDSCVEEVICSEHRDCNIIKGSALPMNALINGEGLELPEGVTETAGQLRPNGDDFLGVPLTLKNRYKYRLRIMFLPDNWQQHAVYGEANDVLRYGQQAYSVPLPNGRVLRLEGELRLAQACWDRKNEGEINSFADLASLHLIQCFPQDRKPTPFVRVLAEGVEVSRIHPDETRTLAECLMADLNHLLYPGCRLDIVFPTAGQMCSLFSGCFDVTGMDYLYSRNNILHTEWLRPSSHLEIKKFQFAEDVGESYCTRIEGQWFTAPQGIPIWVEAEATVHGFHSQAKGWVLNGFPFEEALRNIQPEQTDRLEHLLHPVRFSKEEDFVLLTGNPKAEVLITLEHESGCRETISSASDLEWVMDNAEHKASLAGKMQNLELPRGWYRLSFTNGKRTVFGFYGLLWQTPSPTVNLSREWEEIGTFLPHPDAAFSTDILHNVIFPEQAARNGNLEKQLPLQGIFRVAGLQMPIYAVCYSGGKYYLRDQQAQETARTQGILNVPRNKIWAAHLAPDNGRRVEIRPNADISALAAALLEQLPLTPRPIYSLGLFEMNQADHLLKLFPSTAANAAIKNILRTWHRQQAVIPARLLLFHAIAYAYQQLHENRRKRLEKDLDHDVSLSAYFSFLVDRERHYQQQYRDAHEKLLCFTAWFYDWFNF